MIKDLQIIAPDPVKHREAVLDLTGKTFGRYFQWLDNAENYFTEGVYDWKASRIGIADGTIASHFGVWKYKVRYGSANLQIAGIGAVSTHGGFRKQGLMSKTLLPSLAAMNDLGYNLTVLFGIENFYNKFGYVQAWPDETWEIARDRLPGADRKIKTVKITRQWDEMEKLYNRLNRGIAGTTVRPFFRQRSLRPTQTGVAWGSGRVEGYVILERTGDDMQLMDHAGKADEVLQVIRSIMQKEGYRKLIIRDIPFRGPLARELRRNNCLYSARYTRLGAAMVRTISLERTLQAMHKELNRRVAASGVTRNAMVTLRSAEESVTLAISGGRLTLSQTTEKKNVISAGHHAARLLIGAESPAEMIAMKDISVKGEGAFWAELLFPHLHPTLPPVDHF